METSIEKVRGIFRKDGIVIEDVQAVEWLKSKGYGSGETKRILKFHEALFLLEQRKLEVVDNKNVSLTFDDLLRRAEKIDKKVLYKYLIFRDLRNKGYIVTDGYNIGVDFNVYERGSSLDSIPKYLVVGLCEGAPISFEDLVKILKIAQSNRKTLILAVIDRRNELVYYTISKLV